MKLLQKTRRLLALLLCCAVFALGAQEQPSWHFVQIPLAADEEFIREEIAQFMEDGYYPVGLEVQGGNTLSLLGQRLQQKLGKKQRESSAPRNFRLQQFSNFETLSAEFASLLSVGWEPAGLAFAGESMIGLFLAGSERLTAGKMLPVIGNTFLERQQSINRMVAEANAEGLEPFALSRLQGQLRIGFVTSHRWENPRGNYILDRYENDGISFVEGINARLAEGYQISGYHFHEGQIYIGFYQ